VGVYKRRRKKGKGEEKGTHIGNQFRSSANTKAGTTATIRKGRSLIKEQEGKGVYYPLKKMNWTKIGNKK